jgi:6-pyruvoyltetrahydropterin/6-carboxytetrahydropterin synthase
MRFHVIYKSTKTFGHDFGLSCAFRQWRSGSHCQFIHGYALAVSLEFSALQLDSRNWVIDFGSFGEVKDFLRGSFDHRLAVAGDDPQLEMMRYLHSLGLVQLVVMEEGVGCEAFAERIARNVGYWLKLKGHSDRVWLSRVEVREHGANSAIVEFPQPNHIR